MDVTTKRRSGEGWLRGKICTRSSLADLSQHGGESRGKGCRAVRREPLEVPENCFYAQGARVPPGARAEATSLPHLRRICGMGERQDEREISLSAHFNVIDYADRTCRST